MCVKFPGIVAGKTLPETDAIFEPVHKLDEIRFTQPGSQRADASSGRLCRSSKKQINARCQVGEFEPVSGGVGV
jgi:hypothetical protein